MRRAQLITLVQRGRLHDRLNKSCKVAQLTRGGAGSEPRLSGARARVSLRQFKAQAWWSPQLLLLTESQDIAYKGPRLTKRAAAGAGGGVMSAERP